MRLIDADALMPNSEYKGRYDVVTAYDIANAPTIEPERKRGEWIYDNPNTFKCSKCNKYLDIGCGNMKMNFCPNCGADMREIAVEIWNKRVGEQEEEGDKR